MQAGYESSKLAQSASVLGAGILGFGLGARFGSGLNGSILVLIIIVGGIIHVAGMYVLQMKNWSAKTGLVAKILWVTAWVCLLFLIALIIYLAIK